MFILLAASVFGFGLIFVIPKQVSLMNKVLITPALSLILFGQILLFLAFILKINYFSILSSLVICLLVSIILAINNRKRFSFGEKSSIYLYIVLLIVGVFFANIIINQVLSVGTGGVLKTGGGGMYGDTALHASYASRLATGEFPPNNPLFAGKVLVYPFANDLLSATFIINGLSYNLAFSISQIMFFIAFLILLYEVSLKFTNFKGYVFSLLILFLGWGVGFFYFLSDFFKNNVDFWQILNIDYTNADSLGLHFHNILTGLILPERTFLPGLVLGLFFFLNFADYLENKNINIILINAFIIGILSYWHTHTFIYFSIFAFIFGLWCLWNDKSLQTLKHFLLIPIIAVVVSLPFWMLFFTNHSTSSFFHFSTGWLNQNENLLSFWFRNSFLVLPLAFIGLIHVKNTRKILFLPAIFSFLLANFVVFQPWDWDNIKLISWSFVFFSILAGLALSEIFHKNIYTKLLVLIVLFFSILSGLLSISLQMKNTYVIYDKEDIELAKWARTSTRFDDIFVINPTPNHPIPGLSGRTVYVGYPGHLWVHGIDYSGREYLNQKIIGGDFLAVNTAEVPISYIVLSSANYSENTIFKKVYRNVKYTVVQIP